MNKIIKIKCTCSTNLFKKISAQQITPIHGIGIEKFLTLIARPITLVI